MISEIPQLRKLLALVFISIATSLSGQTSSPSHLERMTYEDLLELFNDFEGDSLAQERIARTYMERARSDGDTVKVARGYDRLARIFQPSTNIMYADSLIAYTQDWNHITYPAMGYILKGYEYGNLNDIKRKYRFFKLGLEYAKSNDNIAQTTYLLSVISDMRNKWGSVSKAHELLDEMYSILNSNDYLTKLKKCTRISRQNNLHEIRDFQLMESFKSFAVSYISQGKIKEAVSYLDSLNIYFTKYDGNQKEYFYWWIKDAEIELSYYNGNYREVIENSEKLLGDKEFQLQKNKYLNTLLFRGLAEYKLNNDKIALSYLDRVESEKHVFGHLHNQYLKMLYQVKLDIYKKQSNYKQQLVYLDKLLEIDSINATIFKFLEPKLVYEMDAAKLVEKKEDIIIELNKTHSKDQMGLLIIALLLLLVSGVAIFYYRQKVIFKRRFESLMKKTEKTKVNASEKKSIDISPTIVEDILHRLKKFELSKDFLTTDITLNSLAKEFQTNSSYLSRVLNHHREMSFSQYLNGLRVGHALNELKTNPTYRKYTIEAIAMECGYKNAASFSRAFYKITGIYPSFFINQLNKREE